MRGAWLLIAGALLVAAPAAAGATPATVNRVAGNDRYETAAMLAQHWHGGSDGVVARGDDPADALAGSYVAGTHIGPIVLTTQHQVPQVSIDALRRVGVYRVRLLGGTSAVGDDVVQQLQAAGFAVERVAGADRYGTAAAIARNSGAPNIGTERSFGRTAILANGLQPADALAAGPLAYGQQWPVLLTTRDALPDVTRAALDDLGVQHLVVVGGTGVISDGVMADLQRSGRTAERVAGADRMATATALADFLVGIGEHVTRVEVASATSFADALALGPHAAPDAPVLLCATRDDCGQATVSWITQHTADVDTVVIAGGFDVVSQTAEAELQAAAS